MLIRFYSFQSFKRLGSKNIKLNRLYWTNVSSPAAKSSYLFKMTKATTGFLALQVSKLSTFSTNAAVPNTFLFLNRALYSAILTQTACLGFFHLHSFLTPVSQPGFEPTSVELHQTGTFRTLYRLRNTAATGCTKYLVLAAKEFSMQSINLFAPVPRSYTSLPLDGVARHYNYLQGYKRSCNLSCLDPFFPNSYAQGEKPFGLELE